MISLLYGLAADGAFLLIIIAQFGDICKETSKASLPIKGALGAPTPVRFLMAYNDIFFNDNLLKSYFGRIPFFPALGYNR